MDRLRSEKGKERMDEECKGKGRDKMDRWRLKVNRCMY